MKFKEGDKVKIISSEQPFYAGVYKLTTFTGVVQHRQEGCTYVHFNSVIPAVAIISGDLELTKNQQLVFDFYTE